MEVKLFVELPVVSVYPLRAVTNKGLTQTNLPAGKPEIVHSQSSTGQGCWKLRSVLCWSVENKHGSPVNHSATNGLESPWLRLEIVSPVPLRALPVYFRLPWGVSVVGSVKGVSYSITWEHTAESKATSPPFLDTHRAGSELYSVHTMVESWCTTLYQQNDTTSTKEEAFQGKFNLRFSSSTFSTLCHALVVAAPSSPQTIPTAGMWEFRPRLTCVEWLPWLIVVGRYYHQSGRG